MRTRMGVCMLAECAPTRTDDVQTDIGSWIGYTLVTHRYIHTHTHTAGHIYKFTCDWPCSVIKCIIYTMTTQNIWAADQYIGLGMRRCQIGVRASHLTRDLILLLLRNDRADGHLSCVERTIWRRSTTSCCACHWHATQLASERQWNQRFRASNLRAHMYARACTRFGLSCSAVYSLSSTVPR